jgi:hypothetical protein
VVFAVLAFVFLYFMSIVTLIFVQLASGLDFMTSLSAIVACINNAGPGLGIGGPGQQLRRADDFQTWVCSAAMLLGRLEVFTHSGAIYSHFVAGNWLRPSSSGGGSRPAYCLIRSMPAGSSSGPMSFNTMPVIRGRDT